MADGSRIEWCDASLSPIKARRLDTGKVGWHCERVSPACTHCYAATFNRRGLPNGGTGLDYTKANRSKVEIFIDDKSLLQPLKWRRPRRIFVESMSDTFGEFVPFELVDRVFAVAALCPQHTFMFLTKRPERMAEYLESRSKSSKFWEAACPEGFALSWEIEFTARFPLPNVWLGCTAENQATADERIPHLLRCPAEVRFVSAEPLLGPIDLSAWLQTQSPSWRYSDDDDSSGRPGIDWVIVGTESGRKRRETKLEWVESIRDQCKESHTAFFNKQMEIGGKVCGDIAMFPDGFQIREFPSSCSTVIC